jgi:hypothetical protein
LPDTEEPVDEITVTSSCLMAGQQPWETSSMQDSDVARIAEILHERNALDKRIAGIINRPMTSGHLGEWIAARIFDIQLERAATAPAVDGRFTQGNLAGKTVNVKWYLKREGILDVTTSNLLDYYLVLAGPPAPALTSLGGTRPWCIQSVHLFDARQLLTDLLARGLKVGVATSVRAAQWTAAEIYPAATNPLLPVGPDQRELLRLFALEPLR